MAELSGRGSRVRRLPQWGAMPTITVALVGICATLALAPSGAAAADVVKDCPQAEGRAFGKTGAYYGDLSVRNISCRTGMKSLQTARFTDRNVRVRGYACTQIGTYQDGGIFRCTAGRRALRFSAGG